MADPAVHLFHEACAAPDLKVFMALLPHHELGRLLSVLREKAATHDVIGEVWTRASLEAVNRFVEWSGQP